MMRMLAALSMPVVVWSWARPLAPARRKKDVDLIGPRIDEIETHAPVRGLADGAWYRTVRDVPTWRQQHRVGWPTKGTIPHEHVAVEPVAGAIRIRLIHPQPH